MDRSDNLTFRVNFAGDGAAKLRDRVKDKLKEFMGDYTDDTLVEYVIVLLKNGRQKVEAKNELNLFLGDDSESFVSWLWDHLEKHLDLYMQPSDATLNEVAKTKSLSKEQAKKLDTHLEYAVQERQKPNKLLSRHGREWKGLVMDAVEIPPLRSVVTSNIHVDEDPHTKVDHPEQSTSPRTILQRKRRRRDERLPVKHEEVSRATINAPRRLLQFAVRDAVGSPRSVSSRAEPSLKRLRSVVSTLPEDSSVGDCTQKIQSVARLPNATIAVAMKAAAEAAKDVEKVRSSGNVFDRLGRSTDELDPSDRMVMSREAPAEAFEEYGGFYYIPEDNQLPHLQRNELDERYSKNRTLSKSYAGIVSDALSNQLYQGGRNMTDVSHSGTSGGNNHENSLMLQYNVAGKADQSTSKQGKDQYQPVAANTSSKMVNVSVNPSTWKPPRYKEASEVSNVRSIKIVLESEARSDKANVQLMKENNVPVSVGNNNTIPAADGQRNSQKAMSSNAGSYLAGNPIEDADSRTIFVSNVHFAATKDSLSHHFSKFGDVLKVVLVTDASTGQPKGSAYVEFMKSEAAECALSFNGTSFLSRILKVVKKSAAPQEATPVITWPQISRGSIFSASRFGRVPFPRGIPSSYRARPPVVAGARSFQWKRDTQVPIATSSLSDNIVPSFNTPRSLTYVRAEPKANGSSNTV